jgi:hypothetical protein
MYLNRIMRSVGFLLTSLVALCFLFVLVPSAKAATIPDKPFNLSPSTGGTITSTNKPTLTFDITNPDNGDIEYVIRVYDTAPTNVGGVLSETADPIIDFSSNFESPGSKTFTVGQAPGTSGYYSVFGHEGQTLANGTYYWYVFAVNIDFVDKGASWAASDGSPGFIINYSSPVPEFGTWIGILTVLAGFGLVYKFMPKFNPGLTR